MNSFETHPTPTRALHRARFTGRIIYVGITKEPILLDDPILHRRELTLLASRNALSTDFPHILNLIHSGQINTSPWITHQSTFQALPTTLPQWLSPEARVIKAVVTLT